MEESTFIIRTNGTFQPLHTKLLIPAYDKNQKGMVFNLLIEVIPSDSLAIDAHGNIATSLKKNLGRVVTILSGLDKSWEILRRFKYKLRAIENPFRVMDARSAGLPLCIALLNIVRTLNGIEQVQHLTGTGILRIDGTFEKSHLEEEKQQVSSQLMESRFINSRICKHVFDLANLMELNKRRNNEV